ncbi:cytochrome P450 family protein [Rhizoctonia solani AG-3 Rhs1AP]|uniref:Cytochrome P450 family protein n=1 Tax=Rhizoctonia solani AG-3 Rhs1AP TaxID=1086054 RepID=X8JTB3_9AGAM|nr:cytochrome P450 family protein [Rhizoctonia solani AG-3 Rhs1AP]
MVYAAFATTVAVILVSLLLARLSYSWILPRPLPDVPHNPVTSALGDVSAIAQFEKDGKGTFTDFLTHLTTIHGPISQILLPWRRVVVIADRAEAERIVLTGKTVDTSEKFRTVFATALPNSQMSFPTNDIWKKHRRLTGPSMSRRYLERMSGRVAFGANELLGLWRAKFALVGSSAFDVASDFHMATMDGIINIALGEPLGCIKSAYNVLPSTYSQSTNIAQLPHPGMPLLYKGGEVLAEGFQRAMLSPCPMLTNWLLTYTSPTWWKHYKLVTSFFADAITRSRERHEELGKTGQGLSTNADCVLDMIIQRELQEGAESLGDSHILDELITYFFAGQDTTASVLSWLVKYLPTDPEIQHRLHEEICTVFGPDVESNEPLDFSLLDNPERVPILEAVVSEALRCAAVAPLISRQLLRDEVVLGKFIPKGTQLFFTTGLMSKCEVEWGADAKEWRPSRWLTSDGAFNRLAGPNIPFGMGQRSCFGQRLALLQLKTYLATMSRVFFFKPVPPEVDAWEAVELILRRPKLCYVSLERWDGLKNHS